MASSAGGDVTPVSGHRPGRPHQQEGAGECEAGQAESGPGRVPTPQHHSVRLVNFNNQP